MKKIIILFMMIFISSNIFPQTAIQNYTITSVTKQKDNSEWEDFSSGFTGKLVTVDLDKDKFVVNTSATESIIYKIVSIPPTYQFFDKENRHVFIYNCVDNNAQTCKVYLSYPPKDSHGLDVTLLITYDWKLSYMFYLKVFL